MPTHHSLWPRQFWNWRGGTFRLKLCRRGFLLFFLLLGSRASADYRFWVVNEIYSNADGSVQFVELHTSFSSQHQLAESAVLISSDTNGNSLTYAFMSDLPSASTANKTMLLATPDFAAQPGAVTPDFIIDPNFLFMAAGALRYPDEQGTSISYTNLPTDGVASLVRSGNQLVYSATNSPKNFAGQSGFVQPAPVRLLSPLLSAGQLLFSFHTKTGKTYLVEATDALAPTNWQTLASFPGTGSSTTVTNDTASPATRFYRLRVE